MSQEKDTNTKVEKTGDGGSAFSGFLRYFYGNFVVLILGFISVPVITRVMSEEQYGRTGMFTTAVTVIYIFAILGMDQAYIRYFYVKGVNRVSLFRRCVLPAFGIVMGLCAVYFALSGYANRFLFGESSTDVTLLVISYTIISVFERFLFLDIRMSQNGKLYSNLNILSKVLYIALIFGFFALLGDNYRVVLYAMTISLGLVTGGLLIRFIIRSKKPQIAAGEDTDEAPEYPLNQRELIRYGLPFILVLTMEWLLSACDRWALRIWADYRELGIYNSAMSIMAILLTFKATFIAFWSPVAMEKYEKQSYEECRTFFKSAFEIIRMLCVLAGFGMIVCRNLIVLIIGKNYRDAITIIPFLTLMPIFSILFEVASQGIKFRKKNRYLNYASAVAILFNVVGNIFFVPRLGGTGAAIATGITYMAYFAIGTFFAEKCYSVGYDNGKTFFYAIALTLYAVLTSFTAALLPTLGFGVLGILIVLIADRRAVGVCIRFGLDTAKKFLGK